MRLYKLSDETEFPEKVDGGYINIRSSERVDVRPDETRYISTGLRITITDSDKVNVISMWGDEFQVEKSGKELCVKITNNGLQNLMLYPGTVIGKIITEKIKKQRGD